MSLLLDRVLPADEQALRKRNHIIILNARRIPPHLLVNVSGKLYSLSVKGVAVDESLEALLTLIRRKHIPTLFVELKTALQAEDLRLLMRRSVLHYRRVEAGSVSCLNPIRDASAVLFGDGMNRARYIFELLPLLREAGALGEITQLNMPELSYRLPVYTAADIDRAIVEQEGMVKKTFSLL